MVKVRVGPDHGRDIGALYPQTGGVRIKDLGNVLLCLHGGGCFDELDGIWSVVLPVPANTQIEEDVLIAIRNEEAEDRGLNGL